MTIFSYTNADSNNVIFQWDSDLFLDANVSDIAEEGGVLYAHFQHSTASNIYSLEIQDGKVQIPNVLLQMAGAFRVFCYVNDETYGKTIVEERFNIVPRPQPPEYIYDPTPVITYPELVQLVEDLTILKTKLTMVDAMAETLPSDELATATVDDSGDGLTFIFGIPGGKQGTAGRGIRSIVKEGSEGLVDHYVINYTDDTVSDFLVTNGADGEDGNGIVSIIKTATAGLVDTYTITFTNGTTTTFNVTNGKDGESAVIDPTLTHEGEAADAKAAGDAIANVMQSDKGSTNNSAYIMRQTASQNFCSREKLQKIIGGTIVRNQQFDFSENSTRWLSNGSVSRAWSDGVLTLSNGNTSAAYPYQMLNEIEGHKYLYYAKGRTILGESATRNGAFCIHASGATTDITKVFEATDTIVSGIFNSATTFTNRIQLRPNDTSNSLIVSYVNVIDLTQMLGTAIANYAYTLESATAGSGIAWLRSFGFFTEPYIPYNAGTLVHVSGLASHDTTDAEGTTHSYPLDNSVELRGVPKLDSSNNLYYDGDEYLPDGTVIRRFGYRAYQSGDESLANAITDGTNTVYLLSNPTTEQAEPYQETQICDDWGTEEFVGVSIPVGTQTFYPIDLKETVEALAEIPQPPTTTGTYTLKVVITASGKTYKWE